MSPTLVAADAYPGGSLTAFAVDLDEVFTGGTGSWVQTVPRRATNALATLRSGLSPAVRVIDSMAVDADGTLLVSVSGGPSLYRFPRGQPGAAFDRFTYNAPITNLIADYGGYLWSMESRWNYQVPYLTGSVPHFGYIDEVLPEDVRFAAFTRDQFIYANQDIRMIWAPRRPDRVCRASTMDLNGDHRGDLVIRNAFGGLCSTFGDAFPPWECTTTDMSDGTGWNEPGRYLTGDFTGDGKTDLVIRSATGRLQLWPSTDGLWAPGAVIDTQYTDINSWVRAPNHFFAADLDGDGKTDVVARKPDGVFDVWRSTGKGFTLVTQIPTPFTDAWTGEGNRFFVVDLDRDGDDDLLARAADGTFTVLTSNGRVWKRSTTFQTNYGDEQGWNTPNRFFVADFDGDGRDDLLARAANGIFEVLRSDGVTYAHVLSFQTPFLDSQGYFSGNRFLTRDVNGDRRTDLVVRSANGVLQAWLSTGADLTPGPSFPSNLTDESGWNLGYRFY